MRTLWFAPTFWPSCGGLETISGILAQDLSAAGEDILVITDGGTALSGHASTDEVVHLGKIPVHRLPIRSALVGPDLALLMRLQRQMAELATQFQPEAVHLHLAGPVPIGYFYLRLSGMHKLPLLITVHDDIRSLRGDMTTVIGQCLHRADWVGTWAQLVLDDVLRWAPQLADRAAVVMPGLPAPPPCFGAFPAQPPTFLCMGRLSTEKGFDLAIRAFAQVTQTHPATQMIVADQGPARAVLETLTARLSLSEQVHFVGQVSDAERSRLFHKTLATLMPSRHREGFGLVALEAAQHGRAVIAARAGALSETVAMLGNGLLTPQEDIPALAATMNHLLANPGEARLLGEIGQLRAGQYFRRDTCTTHYIARYRDLVATTSEAP